MKDGYLALVLVGHSAGKAQTKFRERTATGRQQDLLALLNIYPRPDNRQVAQRPPHHIFERGVGLPGLVNMAQAWFVKPAGLQKEQVNLVFQDGVV